MKPLSQLTAHSRLHRAEEAPVASRPSQPVLDYHFHAAAGDLRASDRRQIVPPVLAPSFRALSNEFLATEMKRDYVAEALFFALIVCVSAWPIVSMFQAMGQLGK